MAAKRVSELAPIASADLAPLDVLPIVDTSDGASKKISVQELDNRFKTPHEQLVPRVTALESQIEAAVIAAIQAGSGFSFEYAILNDQGAWTDLGHDISQGNPVSCILDYYVERRTTGGGADEAVATGMLLVSKLAGGFRTTEIAADADAGVELRVHPSTGAVEYKSSNLSGTPETSRIVLRTRSLFNP